MRDYGQIKTRLWTHPDFKALSTEAKLLLLYLDTCPESNALGCFYCPDSHIMEALQWGPQEVTKGFQGASEGGFVVKGEAEWVLSLHYAEQFPPTSPNARKNLLKLAKTVPKWSQLHPHLVQLFENNPDFLPDGTGIPFIASPKPLRSPLEAPPKPHRTQEQEQEQEIVHSASPIPSLSSIPKLSREIVVDGADLQKQVAPDNLPPPVFEIEMTGGKKHSVFQTDIDRWAELYPAVNIPQALRNMIGWLEGHPDKRSATAKGVKQRINRWLKGDQDKGGTPKRPAGARQFSAKTEQNIINAEAWLKGKGVE